MWYNTGMSETLLLTDQTTITEPAIQTEATPPTIQATESSIFDLAEFPASKHKAYSIITPPMWRVACELFENGMTIRKACEQAGITITSAYYHALNDFNELRNRHACARLLRSNQWADDTVDIAEAVAADPDASMAQVRATEAVIKARQWVIERHNPEEYGARSRVDVNSKSVSVNINTSAGTGTDAAALIAALTDRKR
jgi:hypothetical protein